MFHTMGMLVPELIEALVDLDLPVDSSIDLSLSSGLNYRYAVPVRFVYFRDVKKSVIGTFAKISVD